MTSPSKPEKLDKFEKFSLSQGTAEDPKNTSFATLKSVEAIEAPQKIDTDELIKKLSKIEEEQKGIEQAQILNEKMQADKAKINDFIAGVFDMDYQFIMNVQKMKALSSRHTKKFSKPKLKALSVIKDYHTLLDDKKTREMLTMMAIKSKPSESQLIIRKQNSKSNSSKNLQEPLNQQPDLSTDLQQAITQIKQNNNNNNNNTFIPILRQKSFTSIKEGLFDPLVFHNAKKQVTWPSFYRKDFTLVINENLNPSKKAKEYWFKKQDLVSVQEHENSPYSKHSMLSQFRFKTRQKGNNQEEDIANFDVQKSSQISQPNNQSSSMTQQLPLAVSQQLSSHKPNQDLNNSQNEMSMMQHQKNTDNKEADFEEFQLQNQDDTINLHDQIAQTDAQKKQMMVSPEQRRDDTVDESQIIQSRIFNLSNQQIKILNFKKTQQGKQGRHSQTQAFRVKVKELKTMLIIKEKQLKTYEDKFMEDFYKQKAVQKSLLRSLTYQVGIQQSSKAGIIIEEAQLADSILYLYWKQKMGKLYFIVSNPDVLDRLDQNLDDEKITDYLTLFNLDIKLTIHEFPLEKKQEDHELNEMLNQIDDIHEQSNQYLDLELFNDFKYFEVDSSHQTKTYFRTHLKSIRRKIQRTYLTFINMDFFSFRFEKILDYCESIKVFRQRKQLRYQKKVWLNYDQFFHKTIEVHSQPWDYFFSRRSIPQSEIASIVFNPKRNTSIFFQLFDPDEDYELALFLDKMVHHSLKIQDKRRQSMKPPPLCLKGSQNHFSSHKSDLYLDHKNLGKLKKASQSDHEKDDNQALSVLRNKAAGNSHRALRPTTQNGSNTDRSHSSFKSIATSSLSDHHSLESQARPNLENTSMSSVDHDLLPVVRKNALRKKFGFRRQHSVNSDNKQQIKLNTFKGRISNVSNTITLQARPFAKNLQTLVNIENYEYSSEDSLVKNSPVPTQRKSFRLKLIGKEKSSRSSNSSSSSFEEERKEISVINGFDEDELPNWRNGIEGDLMRRISIKIGKLDSRRSLIRKQSLILLQKKLQQNERSNMRNSSAITLTYRRDSMDGILINRFGYESYLRVDDSSKFIFEVFQTVELNQEKQDLNSDYKDESEDHLTTDESLKYQEDDKFADYDVKIQKQQLKKFFKQQKLQQRIQEGELSKHSSNVPGVHGEPQISTQQTMGTQSIAHSKGKSSLAQLHQNYTSIGTYYKNLSKKQREDQKKQENENVAGEVVSGEEFIEDDENNFYLQMRNNIKIMELLNEAGAYKSPKHIKKYATLKRQNRNVKEFKEDDDRQSKGMVKSSKQDDEMTIFTNSDDKYMASDDDRNPKDISFHSYGAKGAMGVYHQSERSQHSSFKNLRTKHSKKKALKFLKSPRNNEKTHKTKRTLYMKDQGTIERQIIQSVLNQDAQILQALLKKFDLSLDSYRDQHGNTLLSTAVQLGNKVVTELLLYQGADPNIQNVSVPMIMLQAEGNAPLHYSIGHGYTKLTDLLMTYGANERIMNKEGRTPWDKFV